MKDEGKEDNKADQAFKEVTPEKEGTPVDKDERKKIMEDLEESPTRNLMFDQKSISVFRLYCHLSSKWDVFFMILATIGSLGSGVSMPIVAYLSGDMYGAIGGETDIETIPPEMVEQMLNETMNDLIYRFWYVGAGMFVAHFLNSTFWTYTGLNQLHTLKHKYFEAILKQEQGWFDANNAFEFSTKVQAQLQQIELGVGERFGNVLMMVAQMLAGFTIAMTTSWKLTWVMISIAPLILIVIMYWVTALKSGIIVSRKTYEEAGGMAEEMWYNIKTVSSFANFEFERKRFFDKVDWVCRIDSGTAIRLGGSVGMMIFWLFSSFTIAFVYGRTLIVIRGPGEPPSEFNGGNVITVIFSTIMAIMSVGLISPNIKILQEACIASSDYFTLVERNPEIDLSQSTYKPWREEVKGKIEFKDVSFTYPSDPNKRQILDGINILFEPGKKVALVGESGCGKSTTVNLIERLYETTSGEVLIDDKNIKEYDLHHLRNLIGYVQQEPVLFNRSIKDNIIFGREDQIKELGDPDQWMKDACDESYASEFINWLKDKYDEVVGIKGSKLSGGQKQRLAIARAILARPKILIWDEATSALDNKSEKEVQRALDNISQRNVTTIIIAHRLSTIKNADIIYAIKEGKILEKGTHQELLEMKGYYAGLVRSQLAQDEWESKEENLEKTLKGKKSSMQRHSSLQENEQNPSKVIAVKASDVEVKRLRLFREWRDHKCSLFFASLGAALAGGLQPIFGFMMAEALNALLSSDPKVVDEDGLLFGWLFLVVAFVNGIANFLQVWKFTVIGVVLANIFRKKVVGKYLSLHMAFFDINENAPGSLWTKWSIDTMQLNSIVQSFTGAVVNVSFIAIIGLSMGWAYEWRLALVCIAFLPVIVFSTFIRNSLQSSSNKQGLKSNVDAGSILSECVVNTKTIYSFNFQKKGVEMYWDCLEPLRKKFTNDSFFNGFFLGLGEFAVFAAYATVFHVSKLWLIKNDLKTENMTLALNIILMSAGGIGQGLSVAGDFKKATTSFQSLYSTIDTQTLIDPSMEYNATKKTANNIEGKIEFRNVSFSYPTRPDQTILKKVSFVVNPGEAIAWVGYSGCGKSTIIQLLERFYDVEDDQGEILIDDINIKEYNWPELRRKIGLVSQEPVWFKRSVMENVRYGLLTATDEECIKAAGDANIMKFFTGDKMHQIWEDGKNDKKDKSKKKESGKDANNKDSGVGKKEDPVSGGEKQRWAIARAFLKDPKILLLDEATSALDKDSEWIVQKSLDKLSGGRTSITIAHRLSTIENSDKIYVWEAGRIVEQGNHQELMKLGQKYFTLHKYSDTK